MAGPLHAPPGRAGRLWLQQHLAVARRGADLLDHKLRVLRVERQRLALQEERTRVAWEQASREADTWLVRGALLGGERALRLSRATEPARVEVVWDQAVGVRHPSHGLVTIAATRPGEGPLATAALVTARDRYRRALEAAVAQAVVEAAVRLVDAQEQATRRRLRAIERRWLPRLEESLTTVQLQLEEDEHADGVRLRWAAGTRTGAGTKETP
ncbi:MAG: V-type ATP synthase subunit D [Nocardioidaceae bacterium]